MVLLGRQSHVQGAVLLLHQRSSRHTPRSNSTYVLVEAAGPVAVSLKLATLNLPVCYADACRSNNLPHW
jgi:hypothetical protein